MTDSQSSGSATPATLPTFRACAGFLLCAALLLLVLDSAAEPSGRSHSQAAIEPTGTEFQERAIRDLVWRGNALRERGQLSEARVCFEQARSILNSFAAPDTFAVTETLADIYITQGLYADARVMLEQRLEAMRALRAASVWDLMGLRYGLARLLVRMGEYAEAEQLYGEAIAAATDSLQLAYLLNGLAILHDELGDYPRAQGMYERALTAARDAQGNRAIVASLLNNLGYLYKNIGDYTAAKEYYERARQLHLDGGDEVQSAMTLINIAHVYRCEHAFTQAEMALEDALGTLERSLGPDHPFVATGLQDLAEIQLQTGHADLAAPLFQRALDIRETTFGRVHVDTWSSLEGMAEAADLTGDRAAAERLYAEALSVLEAAVGPDNPRCAEALRDMARFRVRAGQSSEALALAVRAESLSREHARLLASSLPERQALRYASARADGLQLALGLAADDRRSQTVRAAWDVAIRSRALVLDEIAARHRALRFDDPETQRVATAYAEASRRLAHLMLTASQDPEKFQSLREPLDSARRDREHWERQLAERSPTFRAEESRRRIGLAEVRAALPPRSALVSFFRYEHWTCGSATLGASSRPTLRGYSTQRDYIAFVLPADGGEPRAVPLGRAASVDSVIEAWSREIGVTPFLPNRAQACARYRAVGSRLRGSVWDPLLGQLGHPDIVFVVPDGALHRVSFAALPVGKDGYLIEDVRFHYLAAERDLAAHSQVDKAASGLLAVGGAEFDRVEFRPVPVAPEPVSTPAIGTRFPPLPLTAEEARGVAAVWARSRRGESARLEHPPSWGPDADSVRLLLGVDATEAAFKAIAPGRQVVHIASHGFFLEGGRRIEAPGTRGIGGVQQLDPVDGPPMVQTSPLCLSGFALAGANQGGGNGLDDEDGIVTAEEIAAMNLRGTEWAVLSACETGVGAVQDLEGVVGLRRAFQVAGVQSLVMSLWAVEDQATRRWMEELYRNRFENGVSTLEAVHRASLAVLQSQRSEGAGEHPFYWAAFVAAGEWR